MVYVFMVLLIIGALAFAIISVLKLIEAIRERNEKRSSPQNDVVNKEDSDI